MDGTSFDEGAAHDMPEAHRGTLQSAAKDIHRDFGGKFPLERIERLLVNEYLVLAVNARHPAYLPALAERFARAHLRILQERRKRRAGVAKARARSALVGHPGGTGRSSSRSGADRPASLASNPWPPD